VEIGPKDLEKWCKDLAGSDARAGYRAVWSLVGAPDQAVPQLKALIGNMKWATGADITRWIADLNDERFATRETATSRLIGAGTDAVERMESVLKNSQTLEQKRRLQGILAAIRESPVPAERLFTTRALMVLEQIGNPEARKLLEEWAKTGPETFLTSEACAVVERLANRQKSHP
jgi:hypothetical protein